MLKDNFIIYAKETKLPKIKKQNESFGTLYEPQRSQKKIYGFSPLKVNILPGRPIIID